MIGLCIYVYRPTHISTTTAVNFVIVNTVRAVTRIKKLIAKHCL